MHVHSEVYCAILMCVQDLCSQCGVWWLHLIAYCCLLIRLLQMLHVNVSVECIVGPGLGSMSPARHISAASHNGNSCSRQTQKTRVEGLSFRGAGGVVSICIRVESDDRSTASRRRRSNYFLFLFTSIIAWRICLNYQQIKGL